LDAYWEAKQSVDASPNLAYESIDIPKNSALGFVVAFFAVIGGFGMIWHIWWMGILALLAFFMLVAWRSWDEHDEYELTTADVVRLERTSLHSI
jgi:cytochrome o ubiquinol oxidase subunit I